MQHSMYIYVTCTPLRGRIKGTDWGLFLISICYYSNMVYYFVIEHGKNPIEHRKLQKYRKCEAILNPHIRKDITIT